MSYDPNTYTRSEIVFPYSEVSRAISESDFAAYCQGVQQSFGRLAGEWSPDRNGEWLTRNYLAIKMIFGASVMLSSLEYAVWRNLRVVEPYLVYYGVFNAGRAWFLTMPGQEWGNGTRILEPSHATVINVVAQAARTINGTLGAAVGDTLIRAKVFRELFSYRFPTTGIGGVPPVSAVTREEAVPLATLLVELAQANSDMLERSLTKRGMAPGGYSAAFFDNAFRFRMSNGQPMIDRDDELRIRQLSRTAAHPLGLYGSIREGFVDDFFESWSAELEDDEAYDPHSDARIIFPFP